MGNIFIKEHNNNYNDNDKLVLKQITVEGQGNCNVCKSSNCNGYKIYSVEYNTNSFVCMNCYIGIL